MIAAHTDEEERDFYGTIAAEMEAAAMDDPEPENVYALFELGQDVYFEYRGEPYRVPPVPYRMGAELLRSRVRINRLRMEAQSRELTNDDFAEYEAAVAALVRACTSLVRPIGWKGRTLRTLGMWHPFRNASDREIGELHSFLLRLRTRPATRLSFGKREKNGTRRTF